MNLTKKAHILIPSFLPLLSSIAGNIGLQASTTTLRALSTGNAVGDFDGVVKIITKELQASLVIAAMASITLFLIAFIWSSYSFWFAFSTGLSIFINCCCAGFIGSMVPITFRLFDIDPALVTIRLIFRLRDLLKLPFRILLERVFIYHWRCTF